MRVQFHGILDDVVRKFCLFVEKVESTRNPKNPILLPVAILPRIFPVKFIYFRLI